MLERQRQAFFAEYPRCSRAIEGAELQVRRHGKHRCARPDDYLLLLECEATAVCHVQSQPQSSREREKERESASQPLGLSLTLARR